MFAHLRRLPFRRCLHTQIPQNTRARTLNRRCGVIVGASVAVASYLTWHIAHGERIALDSTTSLKSSKKALSVDGTSSETTPPPDKKPESSHSGVAETSNTVTPNGSHGKQFPTEDDKTEGQDQSSTEEKDASGGGGGGGAFNPITGEINWDCPCLGGMAYGPCGQEFRDAFSCFIYSEEEPKGINCVDKFQAMQTCFRAHPEVYKDEIMDDDDEDPQTQPDSTDSKPESQKDTSVSSADQNPLPTSSQTSQTDTPATQA